MYIKNNVLTINIFEFPITKCMRNLAINFPAELKSFYRELFIFKTYLQNLKN